MKNYLEFEKEIKSLEEEIDGLKSPFGSEGISEVDTQKIQNLAVELYERHVSFGTRLGDIGKGLKGAIKSYDDAIKSYQGAQSIRNTGEKMVKAGIKEKAANKELPNPMDSTDWVNPPEIDQSKFIGIPGDDEE